MAQVLIRVDLLIQTILYVLLAFFVVVNYCYTLKSDVLEISNLLYLLYLLLDYVGLLIIQK